jgi:hypothetical protein
MFIEMYGSKRTYFNDRGWVVICRTPCPQEPYGAQLEDDAGEPIEAWGRSPLEAIFKLEEILTEKENNQ